MIQPPRALILAAGEGTRLRPFTLDRPKPMVPIAGRPLLEHTIAWLRDHGVCEIAINLHYCPDAIVRHFGDGTAFGVHITYSYEERLLGTAGAVRRLAAFCERGPFLVIYGDVLTDLDLHRLCAFHRTQARRDPGIAATLGLYRVPNPTEVGLVGLAADGRIVRFLEKPRPAEVFTDLANTGILVVEPWVIEHIPADTPCDFGRDLFPRLLADGASLYGWVIPAGTYLLDIGTPEKYAQAQRDWAHRAVRHAAARHHGR
ncbi:MAG: nucleotidyltransferase family protein [Anaerolineae bacterium]|nr:nucleotidyltransferase family protein [Anaerolineae bacterium]